MDDIDADHLAELEANLYAQIHHDAPESVLQYTAAEKLNPPTLLHQQKNAAPSRIVTSSSVHNQAPAAAAQSNVKRGRYWSEVGGGAGAGDASFAKPTAKAPPSAHVGGQKHVNPFARAAAKTNASTAASAAATPNATSAATAPTASDYRPKPFTPYTSYLSQIGTPCVAEPSEAPAPEPPAPNTATTTSSAPSEPAANATTKTTPNAINPASVSLKRNKRRMRQKERRSIGHTDGQLQQLDRARSQLAQELYQRGIGVQRQAGGKLNKAQELRTKMERAAAARVTAKQQQRQNPQQSARPTVFIDLDSDAVADSDADSDEVICVPVPPPPLVCIDDSSEEDTADKDDGAAATKPAEHDGDDSALAEDFVGRRDRDRLSLCTDATNEYDAIVAAALDSRTNSDAETSPCATVDDAIRQQKRHNNESAPNDVAARKVAEAPAATSTTSSDSAEKSASTGDAAAEDTTIFATPKRSRETAAAARAIVANQSYEVAENGFAAVDVYESESSDFPESVYEKGRPSAPNAIQLAADATRAKVQVIDSDSDVSSIQLNTTNRAKRRKKRRSSCNTSRGSDQKSSDDDDQHDDDDAEDDSMEGPAFVDTLRNTSTPYIQRGEAVPSAKSKLTRIPPVPPPKRRRSQTGKGKTANDAAAAAAAAAAAQSDDEFMSMLSCIVHDSPATVSTSTAEPATAAEPAAGQSLADANASSDISAEKTIDARAIVENVLSKVAKNKKAKQSAGQNASTSSAWKVTDDVVAVVAEPTATASTSGDAPAPSTSKSKSSSKKGSAGSVEGKATESAGGSVFFVVDSVGDTDPIPPSTVTLSGADTDGASSSTPSVKQPRMKSTAAATASTAKAVAPAGDANDTSVRSSSLVVDDPEICWNDEMRSFYNKSWGGENYDQSELMRRMPRNRFEWTIDQADLFPAAPQQTRRFNRGGGPRSCYNCREEGHRAADCHLPQKASSCYMCGQLGHREPRCPNTMCLRCGTKTKVFARSCQRCQALTHVQCPLCKAKGHTSRDCPDKWRRYHSTTTPNTPLVKQPIVVNKPKWCCVCASPGHLGEYCRNALRFTDSTPAQPIKIQSYEESYQRIGAHLLKPDGSQLDDVTPYALFGEPQEHYNFAWKVNESADRIYGRMMKATQPERPVFERVSKKRKKTRSESAATAADADDSAVTREKAPRTEISAIDGSKLVLNPMCASMRNVAQPAKQQQIDGGEQEAATAAEHPNSSESTPDANLDDAFDSIIDLSVVDEAVRRHFESTPAVAPASTSQQQQRTVKSLQITVPNTSDATSKRSVHSSEIALNDSDIVRPDGRTETPPQSDSCHSDRPATPPPPIISASAEAAAHRKRNELETEMQRLHKKEAYLQQLKDTLVTTGSASSTAPAKKRSANTAGNKLRRISEPTVAECADDSAVGYHVVLNEDVGEAADASGGTHYDSDSNYSFSEYFKHSDAAPTTSTAAKAAQPTQSAKPLQGAATDSATAAADDPMPDYIPIGEKTKRKAGDTDSNASSTEDEDNIYDDAEADRTSQADSTTNGGGDAGANAPPDDRCSEAKIYLSKDHSKYLMTRQGTVFLNETFAKHDVKLRMEWCSIGNILIVQGVAKAQDNFHADLLAYCTRAETDMRKKQEISQLVPKNRHTLIRFIKEQIAQLEHPLGSVRDCFQRMLAGEQQRSKAGTKNADRARKSLNMMLLGQTGLREGAMHLTALQSNLRCLVETETKDVISPVFRNEVFQHFKYIFSSVAHDNYGDMVREYEDLRRSNRLPSLLLDRKLLGLKINVGDAVITVPSSGPTPALPQGEESESDANAAATVATVETPSETKMDTKDEQVAVDVVAPLASIVEDQPQQQQQQQQNKDTRSAKPQTPKKLPAAHMTPKKTSTDQHSAKIAADLKAIATVPEKTSAAEFPAASGSSGSRARDALPSALWSLKCQQYVDKCRAIPKIQNNASAMARLLQVEVKARENRLSYTDYRMLMKIFDKCV